jgi:very-short-patch-repair endonuclease
MKVTLEQANKLLEKAGLPPVKKLKSPLPQAESELEATYQRDLRLEGITGWRREFYPWTDSKMRFDFAFQSLRILIELDGMTAHGKGAHSKGAGYTRDCNKANRAIVDGYRVLRFDRPLIMSRVAIQTTLAAIRAATREQNQPR